MADIFEREDDEDGKKPKRTRRPKAEREPKPEKSEGGGVAAGILNRIKPSGGEKAEREKKSEPKAKDSKTKAPKAKKGTSSSVKMIAVIALAVIVVTAAAFCYFAVTSDILGARSLFIEWAIGLDPGHELRVMDARIETIANMEADVANRERLMEARDISLTERDAALDAREGALNTRESAIYQEELRIDARRVDLNAWEQDLRERDTVRDVIFRAPMNEAERDDMLALSRIYASMEPQTAAEILLELEDPEEAAAILYFMTERGVSAILAVMETADAARLTEILLLATY